MELDRFGLEDDLVNMLEAPSVKQRAGKLGVSERVVIGSHKPQNKYVMQIVARRIATNAQARQERYLTRGPQKTGRASSMDLVMEGPVIGSAKVEVDREKRVPRKAVK